MIKDNHGYNQYTKEEIIELAQNWFNEHGRLVQRDLKHSNGLPSSCQVTKHFGTLQNLLKEAGIQSTTNPNLFNREQLSDEEMLENYKKFVEEHLKTHMFLPTNDDLDKYQSIQCTSVYISRFGSFNNVNKLIGYEGYNNKVLEEDMIFKYKKACKEYGKVLSSRDIFIQQRHILVILVHYIIYKNYVVLIKQFQVEVQREKNLLKNYSG